MFTPRLINRQKFPSYLVLVCEDDIDCQKSFVEVGQRLFEAQGLVEMCIVSSAEYAAAIISVRVPNLIILDHDMPFGTGSELLLWMAQRRLHIPVMTASGIAENNQNMMLLGAKHSYLKSDIFEGRADTDILAAVFWDKS